MISGPCQLHTRSTRSPVPPLLAACETEEVVLSGNAEDLQLPDKPRNADSIPSKPIRWDVFLLACEACLGSSLWE